MPSAIDGEHPAVEGLFLPVFIYLVYDLLKSAEHKVFGLDCVAAKRQRRRIQAIPVLGDQPVRAFFAVPLNLLRNADGAVAHVSMIS